MSGPILEEPKTLKGKNFFYVIFGSIHILVLTYRKFIWLKEKITGGTHE